MNRIAAALIAAASLAVLASVPARADNATSRINAYATDTLTMRLKAGDPTVIRLRGDGDTDLDLEVTGPRGRSVCTIRGRRDREMCKFVAPVSGAYKVRVINNHGIHNNYRLIIS